MRSFKASAIVFSRKFHNTLAWLALLALFLFVVSALSHPIMVWTGPQSQHFFPPKMELNSDDIVRADELLRSANLPEISLGKVIPTEHGPMLQVTTNISEPRQYLPLDHNAGLSQKQLSSYDEAQAVWLARYYTGLDSEIKSITFIREFNEQYPWVNRLLPVYKVEFNTDDNRVAYVHTETNALGSINNDWKKGLQTIFQVFHTWSWLDSYPGLRVAIVALLLSSLLTMTLGGLLMLVMIKRKNYRRSSQKYHRKLAWVIFLPFCGLLISAFYHLIQSEYGEQPNGMRLSTPSDLSEINEPYSNEGDISGPIALKSDTTLNNINEATKDWAGKAINSLTLIEHEGQLVYRAGFSAKAQSFKPHQHHGSKKPGLRNQRFDGKAVERGAVFLDANGDKVEGITDKAIVENKALNYLGLDAKTQTNLKLISHFGPDYDFRNKRLPVWQIDINNHQGDRLFIDPATGILVEHLKATHNMERLSFSLLHKWNILVPLLGREGRDIAVITFLILLVFIGVFGLRMKWKLAGAATR